MSRPGDLERRLVDAARAHPEPHRVLALREVAVGEAADPVQALDVPELALVQEVLDRERRGEEVEVAHPLAGGDDLLGHLVALPELRLEVGEELVVDHELRAGEREHALDDRVGERVVAVGGAVAVVAALHRREPGALARHVAERDVRERADEHRVVLGQRVALALVQADDERAARAAAERLRVGLVDDADHEVRVVGGLGLGEAGSPERVPKEADETVERAGNGATHDGVRARRCTRCTPVGVFAAWRNLTRCAQRASARTTPRIGMDTVSVNDAHPTSTSRGRSGEVPVSRMSFATFGPIAKSCR